MKIQTNTINIYIIVIYIVFILTSVILGFEPGTRIGYNFYSFFIAMLKILPCAFILIGLFEVWVTRESVEKYFGEKSGAIGYIICILLAGTTVGGLYVAFPVACSLYKKGARISVIFTYIGAAGICRIPMTIFEASFMGIRFTMIRLLVSMPLVILSSLLLEGYLKNRNFQIMNGK